MVVSVLALTVALLLGASSRVDQGTAAAPAAEEGLEVTYGSAVKLMHEKTKVRLHLHDVAYGSGSGQQSVTGFPEIDDSNSYWVHLHSPSLHGYALVLIASFPRSSDLLSHDLPLDSGKKPGYFESLSVAVQNGLDTESYELLEKTSSSGHCTCCRS